MKRAKWIIASASILLVVVLFLGWRLTKEAFPRQVGEDNLIGLTPEQSRSRYGEPTDIVTHDFWIYYRGRMSGGTGITFKDGVVSHVEMRDAQ